MKLSIADKYKIKRAISKYLAQIYTIRIKRLNSIKYLNFVPEYITMALYGNKCVVELVTNETVKCKVVRGRSYRKIHHRFVMKKVNDKWRVDKYQHNLEQNRSYEPRSRRYKITRTVATDTTTSDSDQENSATKVAATDIDTTITPDVMEKLKQVVASEEAVAPAEAVKAQVETGATTGAKLDRDKMLRYMEQNWDKYPKPWGNFEKMGGDCTNFVSQVLHAGGIPMVKQGTYPWYYYNLNDRAPAWTGVVPFYSFIMNNPPRGYKFELVDSFEKLEPGDIIQFAFDGRSEFTHVAVVYNPKGYMGLAPTIAAHSISRFNEPIFAIAFTNFRLIHISTY